MEPLKCLLARPGAGHLEEDSTGVSSPVQGRQGGTYSRHSIVLPLKCIFSSDVNSFQNLNASLIVLLFNGHWNSVYLLVLTDGQVLVGLGGMGKGTAEAPGCVGPPSKGGDGEKGVC